MEISTDNTEADVSESVNGNQCAVCQMPATQKVKSVWCCDRHKAEAYAGKY